MRLGTMRTALWTTLTSLVIVLACLAGSSIGQNRERASKPAAAKKAKPAAANKQAKKFRGRLPNYYNKVVDQRQREMIYRIQAEYAPKIADLQAQLEALTKQRNEKIAAVLSPQQRKAVEDLKAAAKAKRAQKKSRPRRNNDPT